MKDLFAPLTDQEMDRLDAFLLDRVDDDEDTEGKDEGIFDLSTLDGFMTAIVSGPNTLVPSQWLSAVWGDFEPAWESKKEFEEIFSLMVRHMNVIAATLLEAPKEFEPLFLEREAKGKRHLIVDGWCDGYLRGVRLNTEGWISAEEIGELLDTLFLFVSDEGWQQLDQMAEDEVERLQRLIAPAVRDMHAYWLERRGDESTVRRNEPKVGRNDPCPCGSGKKFKKCCGAVPIIH
ncbi:UPF0149 family protein [Ferrovum myxofaciens]|uniref:UPF0149 family protein n=1 Tax=Ferrovum myxofaciens TaxID=416213 RepID=A0A8F3IEZ7_9PROT|nr:UPF0149 family protein [Ferrovum myxofaciens]KXW57274.1 hypothetical protein FEMY_22110 [Ferrovum myxofaciens]QKE39186.1 MAG: UPF0149 family protein [Ferrovum myxofaciens]QWY74435.1 MAG: UPF0149 family protein [Ferrovum myxofaciens]QWY77185.1 MAG: UPF0149 family protein [Ferrovum myxofaciens]